MKKSKIIFIILFILYLAALGFVFFANLDFGAKAAGTWLGIPKDKVIHFFLFLPYPILMYMVFHDSKGKPSGFISFMILVIIIGAVIAGGTEIIQGKTGYRSADIMDFRADCLAIFVSSFFVTLYGAISKKW